MPEPETTTSSTRKLAFIVGNNDYQRPANKLNVCCNNADQTGKLLKKMDFQVTIHQNVKNKDELVGHLQKCTKQIQEDDLVLVYLSGHGCQLKDKNYFFLTENDFEKKEDVEDSAMDISSVIERITGMKKNNLIILILDCCRPYQFKNGTDSTGLTKMNASGQLLIQFGCAENSTARDNLFSKFLLENLGKRMEIRTLFGKIRDDVRGKRGGTEMPLLMYDDRTLRKPVYLYEPSEDLPDIPLNARWNRFGDTMIGSDGHPSIANPLYDTKGISIRNNSGILVSNLINHTIQKNRGAKMESFSAGTGVSGYRSDQMAYPTDAIFDQLSEALLVCDAHNRRVSRWFPGQKTCDEIILKDIACHGIAMDTDGNIYVSDNEKHEVRRYAPGDRRGVVVAGGNGRGSRLQQLNGPTYICMGPKKSLYISDSDNNRVVRWDHDAQKGVIVAGGNGKGRNLTQLDYPTGIVVDRNGTLYVADQGNNRIMRWYKDTPLGEKIIGELLAGDSPSQINGPEGLRFDKNGNLHVVDAHNFRVQRFKIEVPE